MEGKVEETKLQKVAELDIDGKTLDKVARMCSTIRKV